MSTFKILHRITGAVLFPAELPEDVAAQSAGKQLGFAVKAALKAGADLADAYLGCAYLAGADLAGANLWGADLTGANLGGADLTDADLGCANLWGAYLTGADLWGANLTDAYLGGANLAGANLTGADLTDANLTGAYLAGANLTGADLTDANLWGANLGGADLTGANLTDANLGCAKNVPETNGSEAIQPPTVAMGVRTRLTREERMQRFRERNPDVPVIENLDAKILAAVTSGGGTLDMDAWHRCETTHCRAGWAITLAGEAGKALEAKHGPQFAGAKIYRASTGRVPHFFASTEGAMEDIKRCAEEAQS